MTAPTQAVATQQTISQYAAQTSSIQSKVVSALLTLWDSLGAYRDAQATHFVSQAVPTVSGAQEAIARLTATHLGGTAMTGPELSGIRGVAPTDVYQRPFQQLYRALGNGQTFTDAKAVGRARLGQIAASDLQLAKTHQARVSLANNQRVVGYRRVLTGAKSCAMCIIASTVRYRKEALMPIHPACDCAVSPIYGTSDPGQSINSTILHGTQIEDAGDLLESVHQLIHEATGTSDRGARLVDYRKYLITHEHGEMGPILSLRKDHFDGPNDIPG